MRHIRVPGGGLIENPCYEEIGCILEVELDTDID